jgi:predicted TIM-barrel fold metal-dependent hydrolase
MMDAICQGESAMLIVDAQVHLWGKGTTLPPHRAHPYLADECIGDMDAAGIDRAVLHPPSWDPDSGELSVAAVQAYPGRFAILGRLPLDDANSPALIESWKQRPGTLGLRYTFLQPHQKSWPTDGTADWLWPAAERTGVPVALLASEFLPLVGQIAERHPRLKLIVDHLGALRGNKGDAAFANFPQLLALAKHPNIAVKATGGPGYAADAYPFRSLHPRYRAIYDAFGPRRMFWGTDITRMPCSWKQCVTHFTEDLTWLPEPDKELIMGRAMCDWIGWKLPA